MSGDTLFSSRKFSDEILDEILEDYSFYPRRSYIEIDQSRLKDCFREVCKEGISKSASVIYHTDHGSNSRAVSWTSYQAFDSKQLGWRTESIEGLIAQGDYRTCYKSKHEIITRLLGGCRKRGVRYLTHRVASRDLTSIHALQRNGFMMIDGILTFSLSLKDWIPLRDAGEFVYRHYDKRDLPELKRIAGAAFEYDRFHRDPRISQENADRIHELWIQNSCRGLADAIMVAEKGRQVLGFMTCKLDRLSEKNTGVMFGSIDLVATDKRVRSKGLAKGLLNYVLAWFESEKVEQVEVGTQVMNIPASRLYEKAGFRLRESSIFFRKWLANENSCYYPCI